MTGFFNPFLPGALEIASLIAFSSFGNGGNKR